MYYIVNDNDCVLHTDGKFYMGFFGGFGFTYCLYKRKGNAERKCAEMQKKYPQYTLRVVEHKK